MLYRFRLTLIAVAVSAAALVPLNGAAQAPLSHQHLALGLRHQAGIAADTPSGGDIRQPRQPTDFSLYGGARELVRSGLQPAETYGGVTYALPRGWGSSSVEAGYTPESLFVPRQYGLSGEVRTALSDYRALSVGIKYRVYDADPGTPDEAPLTSSYLLATSRSPASSFAPGYQVRFGYQHSASSLFGLALGRDMETYAAALDPASPYPRQLSFTGLHWLTPSWALSYDVLSGDLASQSPLRLQGLGLRFGVRYRF